MDRYRVSKSILKKSDSGNNYYSNTGDSDTEKLITDSMSTTSVCDNETSICDAFVNANGTRVRKRPVSPLLSRQVLESIFRTNNNTERENTSDEGVAKTPKILFGDVAEEEKHARDEVVVEKQNKEPPEEQPRRPKVRMQEEPKDSQATLILRSYKTKKSTSDERRKTGGKSSSAHGCTTYKSSDAHCLPQQYRFSS